MHKPKEVKLRNSSHINRFYFNIPCYPYIPSKKKKFCTTISLHNKINSIRKSSFCLLKSVISNIPSHRCTYNYVFIHMSHRFSPTKHIYLQSIGQKIAEYSAEKILQSHGTSVEDSSLGSMPCKQCCQNNVFICFFLTKFEGLMTFFFKWRFFILHEYILYIIFTQLCMFIYKFLTLFLFI